MPRAVPTSLADGHDAVLVPDAGVAVAIAVAVEAATVGVAVPATAPGPDDDALELVVPQVATATEQSRATLAATPSR
jgi:deoxyinosine 3'endonuclease (endonuclease V)